MIKVRAGLRITNNTRVDIVGTDVSDWDGFDFLGNSPREWNQKRVKAGEYREEWMTMRFIARDCPFALWLEFKDGSVDWFKINLKHAVGKSYWRFDKFKEDHVLTYKQRGGDVVEVIIEHTKKQLDELKAKDRAKEAELDEQENNLDAAKKKLEEALGNARSRDSYRQLKKRLDEVKKKIQERDLDREAQRLLDEASKILEKEKNYDKAFDKATEAEKKAQYKLTKDDISKFKANVRAGQAHDYIKKALEAERDTQKNRVKEAEEYLNKALGLLEQAGKIRKDWDYRNDKDFIERKIAGNKNFNNGTNLEEIAFQHFKNKQYKLSKDKYMDALKEYRKALENFTGIAGLNDDYAYTKKIVDELQDAIGQIDVKDGVGDIHFQDDREGIGGRIQEQYDLQVGINFDDKDNN